MLEGRNAPTGNYRSPLGLATGRKLRSVLTVNLNNLKIKANDDDEFKERRKRKANIMINTQRK